MNLSVKGLYEKNHYRYSTIYLCDDCLILFEKKTQILSFCLLLLTSNLNILSVIFFGDSKVAILSMKTLSEAPKFFNYLKQKQFYICERFFCRPGSIN
jgi:hypothetical protein